MSEPTWRHARFSEPHRAAPDLAKQYVQPGTGSIEAPCLTCGDGEAVVLGRILPNAPAAEYIPSVHHFSEW